MTRVAVVLLLGGCILFGVGAVASTASSTPKAVKVSLGEYAIVATPGSVAHGKVTFTVTNTGMHEHEFVVVKTKQDATKLLTKSGKANEAGSRGELEDIAPGQTKKLTLTLPVGHYVFLCNLKTHYKKGMSRNFVVK